MRIFNLRDLKSNFKKITLLILSGFVLNCCTHNPYRPDLPRLSGAIPQTLMMRHQIIPVGNFVFPNRLLYYGQSYKLDELERVFYFTNSNSVLVPYQNSEMWADVATVFYAGFLASTVTTAALMVIPSGTGFDSAYLMPMGITAAALGLSSAVSSYVAHHYRKKTVENYNSWLDYNLKGGAAGAKPNQDRGLPQNSSAIDIPSASSSPAATGAAPDKGAAPEPKEGSGAKEEPQQDSEEDDSEGANKNSSKIQWTYAVVPMFFPGSTSGSNMGSSLGLISGNFSPVATVFLRF